MKILSYLFLILIFSACEHNPVKDKALYSCLNKRLLNGMTWNELRKAFYIHQIIFIGRLRND